MGENQWIWAFGTKIRVETRFEKNSLSMLTFSQTYTKNHRFGNFEPIWNGFGHSKYFLGIWMKK